MRETPPHLKALKEIEKTSIPGLVEVLRKEGLGDGGEDREDFVRGPARGAQTAGEGDEGDPLQGARGLLQKLLGLRAGVLIEGSDPSFRPGEDILAALG